MSVVNRKIKLEWNDAWKEESKSGIIRKCLPLCLYEVAFKFPPLLLFRIRFAKILNKYLMKFKKKNIAFIGSSTGYLFPYLTKLFFEPNFTFYDIEEKMVAFSQKRFNRDSFKKGDFYKLKRKFEMVVILMVEYESPEQIISQLKKILVEDGIAIIKPQAKTIFSTFISIASLILWNKPILLIHPNVYLRLMKNEGFLVKYEIISKVEGTYIIVASYPKDPH